MYTLICLFPLLNSILSGLFGWYLGKRGCVVLSISLLSLTALFSWIAFFDVVFGGQAYNIVLFTWIHSGYMEVNWCLFLDSLSVTMLIVVTSVAALVHIYSTEYMGEDPHICRFLSYISLFTFCMILLVTADNLIQLFFGWEGVGLCSYLLISFWYTRIKANKAALKAVIINRVADVFIVLALGVCFVTYGSLKFEVMFSLTPLIEGHTFTFLTQEINTITLICILLFLGAMGKSAQIGLHTWLPDAMEGPTPVSALIHAATMVTAGVFLVIRCSPIFEYSSAALSIVAIIGAITAFMSATIALTQHDIKKVIAYSTCSQLGYMFFACGLSNYHVGLFHLFNHAFFKALLFLSAGSVIHAMRDEQDMRKLGGTSQLMPITYTSVLIGSLSLAGFPFLSGFYSKDFILETSVGAYTITSIFTFWLGSITAFLTAFYSFRLFYISFMQTTSSSKSILNNSHESDICIIVALTPLAFGSILSGYLFRDAFIGMGTFFFSGAIYVAPESNFALNAEFISFFYKAIPLVFSSFGIVLAIVIYSHVGYFFSRFWLTFYPLTHFLSKKWYFDTLYNRIFTDTLLKMGYSIFFKGIDKGLIEMFGPTGASHIVYFTSRQIKRIQTGYIHDYLTFLILGIVFFFLLLL